MSTPGFPRSASAASRPLSVTARKLSETDAGPFLEALGLERRPPDTRFFEDLFLRFQRRVATETLTRPAGNAATFDAAAFFGNWIEEERGLVGDERAGAFVWLARQLGFACEVEHSICSRPWETETRHENRWSEGADEFFLKGNGAEAHRAVVARVLGRRILADAGFPLPVLLPLDASSREFPTGLGTLKIESAAGSDAIRVTCDARGAETELLRVGPVRLPASLPIKEISRTPPAASPPHAAGGRAEPFALRVLDDRVLFWRAGRMTIVDAWSRLEYPLPSSKSAAIAKLFALELDEISLPESPSGGDPEPATLSVFHLSPGAPDDVRGRVGRNATPLILVSSREELVEAAPGGSRVTIQATLTDVPPEGPGEAVRKTLVFHLVSEIFALSRPDGKAD